MKFIDLHIFFWFLMMCLCFSFSLLKKNGEKLVSSHLKYELHCQNWNANITSMSDSFEKLVQAILQPLPAYENCFTHYFAYLHLLKPKHFECNLSDGIGIKLKKVEQFIQEQIYDVKFTNLEPGYYCILFQPCAEKCYDAYIHSNVVKIKENPNVTSKHKVQETTNSKFTNIVYICVVLILILICCLLIYWNYKHRKMRKISETVVEKGADLPFLPLSENANASEGGGSDYQPIAVGIEVFIFYYPQEDIKRKVDCFADFLKKCAEFIVTVIDKRLPEIHFETVPWSYFEAILHCCSIVNGKCICKKRFIIVMTRRVIAYMHSMRQAAEDLRQLSKTSLKLHENYSHRSCSTDDDDIEADWFCYGLRRILMDWDKCFTDYNHYFVIYFDDILYIEEHDIITVAPSVRFSIRYLHLIVKLCQELNELYEDASHLRKLINSLNEHPIKHLIESDL